MRHAQSYSGYPKPVDFLPGVVGGDLDACFLERGKGENGSSLWNSWERGKFEEMFWGGFRERHGDYCEKLKL